MPTPKCRKRALSLGRRILCDFLRLCNKGQTAGAERLMQLQDVVAARSAVVPRPSWCAIMTKAFALAARNHPEIRSAYFSFPWGHIGEYASQVATVFVDRRVGNENVMFLAPLVAPEQQSLQALDEHLRRYKNAPVESVRAFRNVLWLGRLPGVIRRFLGWLTLDALAGRRARHYGTFGVTTMSPYGAKTLHVPCLWSALLHYGATTASGETPVGLAFDHRVMDGAVVGYTLLEMEQVLHHQIVDELRGMADGPSMQSARSA